MPGSRWAGTPGPTDIAFGSIPGLTGPVTLFTIFLVRRTGRAIEAAAAEARTASEEDPDPTSKTDPVDHWAGEDILDNEQGTTTP